MPHPNMSTISELTEALQESWSELEEFLSTLTEDQLTVQDDQGWTVSDHIMHMAEWESSVVILFEGRPRHEALGIDEATYLEASIDEINGRLQKMRDKVPAHEAIAQLREVHLTLIANLPDLTQADLQKTVRDFFPKAPRSDERRVVDFIYEDTGDHFLDHLKWMRTLVSGAA